MCDTRVSCFSCQDCWYTRHRYLLKCTWHRQPEATEQKSQREHDLTARRTRVSLGESSACSVREGKHTQKRQHTHTALNFMCDTTELLHTWRPCSQWWKIVVETLTGDLEPSVQHSRRGIALIELFTRHPGGVEVEIPNPVLPKTWERKVVGRRMA